jgi:hypothetical protein
MALLFNFSTGLNGRPAPWSPPPLGELSDAELVASMRATNERVRKLASRPRREIALPPAPAPVRTHASHKAKTGGVFGQTHEKRFRTKWVKPATPRPVAGPPILERDAAVRLRLPRYFTGRACKRGHFSERRVSDNGCVQCDKERSRRTGSRSPKYRYRTIAYPSLKNPFPH